MQKTFRLTTLRSFGRHYAVPALICLTAISVMRFSADAHAQAVQPARQVWPGADQMLERIEFENAPLADAVRLVSGQTKLNIVCTTTAGVMPISLFLQNVTARTAIMELCKAHNLSYRVEPDTGVVRISTIDEFQKSLTSFSDQQTKVFTLLYPNPVPIASAIADLYGDRVKLSLGNENSSDNELQDLQSRFSRFDLVDQRSQGLGNSGQSGTSSNGGYGNTSTSGGISSYGNNSGSYSSQNSGQRTRTNTNNTDLNDDLGHLTADQANRLARSLAQNPAAEDQQAVMDAYRKRQTNIYISVLRRNNNIVVRTSDIETMNEIGKLIERLDVPTSLVMLEVKVLAIDLTDTFNSAFDFQITNGSGINGQFSTGDIIAAPANSLTGAAQRAASLTPGGTGVQSSNAIFQVVSNSFRARLQVLESKNRVTQLAAPLLLTANNEVSRLFVGEEYPIVQNITSQTVVNNNTSTTTPNTTINFQPVGTTLLLTPNINADRTVTLRVLQENSQVITGGATIPIVTGNGTIQSQSIDIVSTRTFSGTVVAKDSLTLAIGGLISEQVNDQRNEVPILGKIPILGVLFRQQTTGRSRTEFVILVRPYILNTPAESEGLSQKLMKDLSIHPKSGDFNGTMDTFVPNEVPRPNPGKQPIDRIFRFHSVYTGAY